MGPRGPLRGRSPLRGLRPPQAARPRPADPPAVRDTNAASRHTKNHEPHALPCKQRFILCSRPSPGIAVHAARSARGSGFRAPRKRGPGGVAVFVFFRVGPKARFVSRRRARSEGSPGMADGRRRALALGEVRRPGRAMRRGRAPGAGFSWPRAQRGFLEMSWRNFRYELYTIGKIC